MPTGAVDWQFLIWLLTILGAVAGGSGGAVLWGFRLFAKRDRMIATVREECELRVLKVETEARVERTAIINRLTEYERHVGETFATKHGVSVQLSRVEDGLKSLGDKIEGTVDRLTARIDRLLEARNADRDPRKA